MAHPPEAESDATRIGRLTLQVRLAWAVVLAPAAGFYGVIALYSSGHPYLMSVLSAPLPNLLFTLYTVVNAVVGVGSAMGLMYVRAKLQEHMALSDGPPLDLSRGEEVRMIMLPWYVTGTMTLIGIVAGHLLGWF